MQEDDRFHLDQDAAARPPRGVRQNESRVAATAPATSRRTALGAAGELRPGPNPFAASAAVRPKGSWYIIVIAIGVAISIIGVVVIVRSAIDFADKIDDFRRVEVPSTTTIPLDAGSYTVYAEGVGVADVTIRRPNEQIIELRRYSSEMTYDVGSQHGRAVFSFRAPVTGRYFVSTTGPSGAIVAIGPGLGSGLVAGILSGIGLILSGIVFAIVGSIVVGVKRGRSRRAQFQPFAPSP